MRDTQFNIWLHTLAVLTAATTFPLIFIGGLVTSHGAGMSVPDWPNSYGYNMFLFPPSKWLGGIFYEHTHRLMGTLVGFLAVLLTIVAWKVERRPRVRWVCTGVLVAIIFQGVLGGLRVVLVNLDLAVVHACVAQAFFCLAALSALMTSRWWIARQTAPASGLADRTLARLAALCVVVIYGQLIVGALMRHYNAGLAIPDIPLAYGKWLPPTTAEELTSINHLRLQEPGLLRVTLDQIWLNFGHRLGAILVSITVAVSAGWTLARSNESRLRRPAWLMGILLIAQLILGIFTILMRKPADLASTHVAVGALLLVTAFVLTARAWHFNSTADTRTQRLPTGPTPTLLPKLSSSPLCNPTP